MQFSNRVWIENDLFNPYGPYGSTTRNPLHTGNFPIVYGLKTTFTDGITLARSNKQYGSKWGIFNLYQIVCIGHDCHS